MVQIILGFFYTFGYAQIHIEITTADEKIISFTSDYLVVAVKIMIHPSNR